MMMKESSGRRLLAGATLALCLLAAPAHADWNDGEAYKWVQHPDLSFLGLDVQNAEPYILADDFLCDQTGPLTGIHLWSSWLDDHVPHGDCPRCVTFILSIHKDIPAAENPDGYSIPGELLWWRVFQPTEFQVRIWAENLQEGWLQPPDDFIFPGDTICWQYNFQIPTAEAFYQEGTSDDPIIYWLDVQAISEDPGALYGWKTSQEHWNDSAVWGMGSEPYGGPWSDLHYPANHEQAGQRIDLAFVVSGEEQQNDLDFGDAPDAAGAPQYRTLLANNGARHAFDPTFYLGTVPTDGEPDGQPDPGAQGDDNNGAPDEDGVTWLTPLIPGQSATIDVLCSATGRLDGWIDWGQDFSWTGDNLFGAIIALNPGSNLISFTVPSSAIPGPTFARFRLSSGGGLPPFGAASNGEVEDYQVIIEPPQTGEIGDRVWDDLNGNGIQDAGEPGLPNVIVRLFDCGGTLIASTSTNAAGNYWFSGLPPTDYFLNFSLLVGYSYSPQDQGADDTIDSDADPTTGNTICTTISPGEVDYTWDCGMYIDQPQDFKWVQHPDLSVLGIDVNDSFPFLLADDFECTVTGPITEVWVWGSWLWDYLPDGENPALVDFTLSFHRDIPAVENPDGYSIPGEPLWWRDFQPSEFSVEAYATNIEEGWLTPPDEYIFPADTVCWLYKFHIPSAEAFFQQGTPDNPVIYWLDVQARPLDPQAFFGWKTSQYHWNDDAVWAQGIEPWPGPWFELIYPQGHEQQGQSIDLAFAIMGDEQQPPNLDYGDAPDPSYPTLLVNDGARHIIAAGAPIFLGAGVDPEPDGQPNATATGDDNDGNDDEDGIVFLTPLNPGGTADVQVTAGSSGRLNAWVDFDANGSWADAGDQIFTDQFVTAGVSVLTFNVPVTGQQGHSTFARFRFNSAGGLNFMGAAADGEVEDYDIDIENDLTDAPADALPERFGLGQNVPNPFNPTTLIRYELPLAGAVKIEVFDVEGRLLRVLIDGHGSAGYHEVAWNGRDEMGRGVPTGVYLYRMSAPGFSETRKMLLLQ